jgi:hypothetical protein
LRPWLERRPQGGGKARTHALVIGVSYYQFLPQRGTDPSPADRETFGLRQARTPATSAWKFAQWLKRSYGNPAAPLGSVRLLVSPSQWERENVRGLDALPVEVLPGTRENVVEAVDAWHDAADGDTGNVAILYVSGHGIQLSKDEGGIVLLEDFAKRKNAPLDHSLDVGAIRKGMAGETMAQQQFYFVDACEVRPPQAANWQSLGTGVTLRNPFEGAVHCSPVYFSAAPSTEALGRAGDGTLFIQALLDCLALGAVDDHVHENDTWVVTTLTLSQALLPRVTELAQRFNSQQVSTVGGQMADVIFHVLRRRPRVPLTLELHPVEAAKCARGRLWDGIGPASIFENKRLGPTLTKTVPAGKYVLTVSIEPPTPPYRPLQALPVVALPPAGFERVPVV